MKIKMTTTMAGPTGAYKAGTIVEMEGKAANALITGGYATALDAKPAAAPLVNKPKKN